MDPGQQQPTTPLGSWPDAGATTSSSPSSATSWTWSQPSAGIVTPSTSAPAAAAAADSPAVFGSTPAFDDDDPFAVLSASAADLGLDAPASRFLGYPVGPEAVAAALAAAARTAVRPPDPNRPWYLSGPNGLPAPEAPTGEESYPTPPPTPPPGLHGHG